MQKLILLCLIVISCSSHSFAQGKPETVSIKVSIYCDHCLACESCGKRLETAVYAQKGIKRVDIDDKAKTVTVVYNPSKTNALNIKTAIAKSGFDADDIKADPKAYDQLDGCCKK